MKLLLISIDHCNICLSTITQMLQHTGMEVFVHFSQCRISYTISDIRYLKNTWYPLSDTSSNCSIWTWNRYVYQPWAWLYQKVHTLVLKCGSNESNIQIKLILSQKYCMNENRFIWTFLGSGSLDPNIWMLLPFFVPIAELSCDENSQVSLTYSYNLHLWIMIQISEWGWIRKRWFNTKFTPQCVVLHIRVNKWFKWTHILGSNDWYNTFGVIFKVTPRYLVQTWTWTLWYNQALVIRVYDFHCLSTHIEKCGTNGNPIMGLIFLDSFWQIQLVCALVANQIKEN